MKRIMFYTICIVLLGGGELVLAAPPGDFTLNSPTENATGVDRLPTFRWNMSANAISYKLQICNDTDFSANWVAQEHNLTSTQVALPTAKKLVANCRYFWRVVAFSDWDNKGETKSSLKWSFTTINESPAVPTLASPANGATNVSTDPVLSWNGVGGVTNYLFQIHTSSTFPSNHPVTRTGTNLSTQPTLSASTTYYWRVGAENGAGFSGYSGSRSFTTKANATVTAPTLSSPASNATGVSVSPTLSWGSVSGADYYLVEVSRSSSFVLDQQFLLQQVQYPGTTLALSGLTYSTDYWWRVTASNGMNTATSASRKFTTLAAPSNGVPTWPRGTVATLNSPFGPRNMAGNSWFHTGIDMGGGQSFVAPFNMKCVYRGLTTSNPQYLRLVFENTEAGGEPKNIQFEECNPNDLGNFSAPPDPPTTYTRGQTVATTGADGNYVHMDAFPTGTYKQDDWSANRLTSRNPLQWWSFTAVTNDLQVLDILPHQATDVVFPTEGDRRYFEIHVRQKRACMALNKIKISLTDNDSRKTSVFLEDTLSGAAAALDFNVGTGVQRAQGVDATSETHDWTGTGYTKTKDGVKIFTRDVTATEKDLVFRYYLTSNTSIKPTEVKVELLDALDRLLVARVDWRFEPVCVDCAGGGPKPPEYLSAVQYDNGIKLEWNASPANPVDVVAYSIYRRPSGVNYNPQSIAVVPSTKRVYYDRFDTPGNDLKGGTTYLYSIASVGVYNEGCNGPPKIGCTGYYCPLMCVNEKSVTTQSLPLNVLYANRMVFQQISDVKAKYGVTTLNDRVLAAGKANFTAGYTLDITGELTIENGATVNLKVDPAVQ